MVEAPIAHALLLRVGDHICALSLSSVIEVMRPLPLEEISGLPGIVGGVSLIRGKPTPVVRLGAFFDAPQPTDGRFVAIRAGERVVALEVDSIAGIGPLPGAAETLPPLLSNASAGALETIAVLDRELMLVLDSGKIVPEQLWNVLNGQER
jgi:purine-binding chemotaxis protein CheW